MSLPGKMKLLLIGLHFSSLCTLSSWSVSLNSANVRQTADMDVFEGEAVNISCCWTGDRARATWLKNQKTYKNDSLFTDRTQESHNNQIEKCSILNFTSITKQDSGEYVCEMIIEIPVFNKIRGNGTIVTVKTRENRTETTTGNSVSSNGLPVPIVASVAAVSLLLLVAFVWFCCLRRTRGHAARVIHESPYTNSDSMEMDKHSTSSSRGSSQWCQVPVYDSLDYFEHVENKGSE